MKASNLLLIAILIAFAVVLVAKPAAADTVVYSQDFNANDGGYTISTSGSDEWQWGTPTNPNGPAAAHSAPKCWGTNLLANVAYDSDSFLVSPAIDVPTLASNQYAYIQYWGWASVNTGSATFSVSSDGVTWEKYSQVGQYSSSGWQFYSFDISKYAGKKIYLNFSLTVLNSCPGFYIDDVSLSTFTVPAGGSFLTLNAFEAATDSCPWVYSWNGESFVPENDVYSTARGVDKEYVDYYTLKTPVVAKDGLYTFDLREVDGETSYTDMVQLVTVDHASGVRISNDEKGNVWTYTNPSQPASAITDNGNNVLTAIDAQDGKGVKLYNGDYVLLDFSNLDVSKGATLVMNAQGFLSDADPGNDIAAPPRIFVQTQDAGGNWVTVATFYPRMESATNAYNLEGYFTNSKLVRLYATSCAEGKYHILDYVGLDTAPQAPVVINTVSPISAISSANGDVWSALVSADGNYATMNPTEDMSVMFPVPMKAGDVRDMMFVSKGYYLPHGSFLIQTWDGSKWVTRYDWSIAGSKVFQKKLFDLSSYLPDSNGKYEVRVKQTYMTGPAALDYAVISVGDTTYSMTATDLGRGTDVTPEVSTIDDGVNVSWGAPYGVKRPDNDGKGTSGYRQVQLIMSVPVVVTVTPSPPSVSFPLPNPAWWYNGTDPYAGMPAPTVAPTPVPTPVSTPVPTQTPSSGTGATATPIVASTVTPTPTPVPSSSENTSLLSNNLLWILLAVLVLAAVGTWYVTRHK